MTVRAYTYYENIAIDQECRHATVAPDIELVGQVLKYFMEHCEGDRDFVMKNRIIMPYLSFDKFESQWYQYLLWLNDMIKQYGPNLINMMLFYTIHDIVFSIISHSRKSF